MSDRLSGRWVAIAIASVLVAAALGVMFGPTEIPRHRVLLEVLDRLPLVSVDSGLTERQADIVWTLRLPRVCLGLIVGALLAGSGAAYQGTFRNSLADPYLLGAAAGAGLGVTIAIVSGAAREGTVGPLPLAAFAGALAAVTLTYAIGAKAGDHSTSSLVLAGVAITSFLTAIQTYLQQRHADTIREVYSWILGRLSSASWRNVAVLLPYLVITSAVLIAARHTLDVMAVGDREAASLGLSVRRARLIIVIAASFATAAAVSASGLIAFVGIIVPHCVRLGVGRSYRTIIPLSILFGGAFLTLADLLARSLASGAEIPIGVVTAFFGAPFFLLLLRTRERA